MFIQSKALFMLLYMQDRAVFVVEVSGGISGPAAVAPRVTVLRIPNFGDPSYLRNISCLQITDTGLFLNWNPSHSSVDFEFSFYQHLQQPITYAGEHFRRPAFQRLKTHVQSISRR